MLRMAEVDGGTQLPAHWLFAGVAGDELMPVLEAARVIHFVPGEVLFHERERADGLYLITGGTVRVAATADTGETMLAIVGADDVVGEMGVLDGQPRSGTATALSLVTG
jgi:CRP-like cAMP-binding protein